MRRVFYIGLLLLLGKAGLTYGQTVTIGGATSVCPGEMGAYNYSTTISSGIGCSISPSSLTYSWTVTGGTIGSNNYSTTASGVGLSNLVNVVWTHNTVAKSVSVVVSGGCNASGNLSVTLVLPAAPPAAPASLSVSNVKTCVGNQLTLTAEPSTTPGVVYFWEYLLNNNGPYIRMGGYSNSNTATVTIPAGNVIRYRVFTRYNNSTFCWIGPEGNNLNKSTETYSDLLTILPIPPTPTFGVCLDGTKGTIYLKTVSGPSQYSNYYVDILNMTSIGGINTGEVIHANDPKFTDTANDTVRFYYDYVPPPGSVPEPEGNPTDGCSREVIFMPPVTTDHTLTVSGAPNCNAGLNVSGVSGGTSPYTYSINGGTSYQPSTVFTGLTPGTKTLRARDRYGCVGTTNVTTYSVLSLNTPVTTADCPGSSITNGKIALSGAGGRTSYQYAISTTPTAGTYQAGREFSSLANGTYHVFIRDANNCTATTTASVSNSPAVTISSAVPAHPTCYGSANGSITVTAGGGTGALSYSRDGSNFQTSNILGSLSAGSYTVTVRDTNTCIATNTPGPLVNPPQLVFSMKKMTRQSCPLRVDGTILLGASGGTGARQYSIDGGLTYVNETLFTGLESGSYALRVRDANSCVTNDNIFVGMKPVLSDTIVEDPPISCYGMNDGTLVLSPSGGSPPYTYLWSNGDTSTINDMLSPDEYIVDITDSAGCLVTVSHQLEEPGPFTVRNDSVSNYTGYNVTCRGASDGFIAMTTAGGTQPYSYTWSGSATNTTEDLTGKPAGTYSVVATDDHGCKDSVKNIVLSEPPLLTLDLSSKKDIRCNGGSDGAIRVIPGGGVWQEPYEYTADIALLPWQDSVQFLHLSARSYTVYIRDANNCTATLPVTLTEPPLLALSLEDTTNTLCGYSNGSAEVSATGGSPGYVFTWYDEFFSGAGTGTILSDLPAGVYMATVRDSHDCLDSVEVFIENSDGPVITRIDTLISPPRCHDTGDGSIGIAISQGQTPYSIQWRVNGVPSATHTTEELEDLAGGVYTARVTDAEGCMDFETISIPSPLPLDVREELVNPVCVGSSDGSITLTASGGNGGYGYIWTHGPSGPQVTGLSMGAYTAEIRDSKNCILHHTTTLSDPPATIIDIGEDRTICVGQQVRIAPILPGTYVWTSDNGFNSTSSDITVGEEGLYRVVYTSPVGCIAEDEMRIVTSTDLLQADFLMISEAHAGDTVLIIDISWPLPDNIGWQFPEGVTTLSSDGPLAEVIFNDPGEYTVTLNASIGECIDDLVKLINVLEARPDFGERQAAEGDFIRDVNISPNPNDGRFTVAVELREKSNVYAAIVTQDGSRILYSLSDEGDSDYQWDINLPQISSGLYYLIVKAGDKVKVLRLIKN